MSKSDHKFVNTSREQEHELKDWLYRNGFSKKQDNIDALKVIINEKVKAGMTTKNITWDELDDALKKHPDWFSSLVLIGQ
ncbi:hypothetical protein LGA02_000032 [Salmonella enterica]|nr:hypothetical protein [Salmonella enterica subsp. diarizonae]EAQ0535388.1 hypothetical protein [Salmonella enterica]EKR1419999.1 hypothetical protein [Salmonella enterica subsp. diarizonae serovar 50:z:z52]EAS6512797.1 hypothetical protein [Salmonella enterica]EBB6850586.1 hypothetical protein [Salmonella enterica]